MSDMRKKLASVVYDEAVGDDEGRVLNSPDVAAAIIAALPDMVKPLEWEKVSETKWRSGDYEINEPNLSEFVLTYRGTCIGVRSGGAAFRFSRAAAQAHHTAAILSALGLTK